MLAELAAALVLGLAGPRTMSSLEGTEAPMAEVEAEDTEHDRTETSFDQTEMSLGDIIDDDEKVVINVGGSRHEILLSTLASKPGTRLSHLTKRHKRGRTAEYYFDRHPGVFNTVMDYYRSGRVLNSLQMSHECGMYGAVYGNIHFPLADL